MGDNTEVLFVQDIAEPRGKSVYPQMKSEFRIHHKGTKDTKVNPKPELLAYGVSSAAQRRDYGCSLVQPPTAALCAFVVKAHYPSSAEICEICG